MNEGRRGRKAKRWGKRGPCSYCGKVHKKGRKRGDSCGGHAIRKGEN